MQCVDKEKYVLVEKKGEYSLPVEREYRPLVVGLLCKRSRCFECRKLFGGNVNYETC